MDVSLSVLRRVGRTANGVAPASRRTPDARNLVRDRSARQMPPIRFVNVDLLTVANQAHASDAPAGAVIIESRVGWPKCDEKARLTVTLAAASGQTLEFRPLPAAC